MRCGFRGASEDKKETQKERAPSSMSLSRREERGQVDAGQEVLRATNNEIRRVSAHVGTDAAEFVCECGAKDCDEVLRLTLEEYETFCTTANGTPLVARSHR